MKYFCPKCMSESEEQVGFCIACGSYGRYVPMVYVKQFEARKLKPISANQVLRHRDLCIDVWGLGKVPISSSFSVGVFGVPYSGKTTFMIALAQKIIKDLKQKVLFVSWEENLVSSLANKLKMLEVRTDDLLLVSNAIADEVVSICDNEDIRWVMLDSYSMSKWSIVDLETMRKNGLVLIFSVHTNKEDEIAGSRSLEHYVDIMIEVSDRNFEHKKNRYGELLKGECI